MQSKLTYNGFLPGLALILTGFFLLALGLAIPFLVRSSILAFFLMSLPALFSGTIAALHGAAVIAARIEITDTALKLIAPKWRVFPMPPIYRLILAWDEVLAVRYRREVYELFVVPFFSLLSFPVDVFAIDTTKGRVVLGGRSIPGMQGALAEIIRRAGICLKDEGEIRPGLMRSLLKGSAPWGKGQEHNG